MNPIVGIGEVLWDVYPDGRKVAGGAPFNFAFHCHQLGHDAVIVSRVGDDDLGRELRARVSELGLSDEYIQTDPVHPTGTVQVTLDANAIPTYTIAEYVAWDHIAWEEKLEALAKSCRAVCFGSLAQRNGTPAPTVRLANDLRKRERPRLIVCDVNMRGSFYVSNQLVWSLLVSDWRKVNANELVAIQDHYQWPSLSDLVDGFQDGRGVAILTRGELGCEVYRRWKGEDEIYRSETFSEPGAPAKVVDTVGAGDAFTAAMVCFHLEGKSLRECARFAVHYAARVCEQPGGTPRINRAEVERAAGLST